MPISQPNSALARADMRVTNALTTATELLRMLEVAGKASGHAGNDVRKIIEELSAASGALNFAGNSQQKLIDACRTTEAELVMLKPRLTASYRANIDAVLTLGREAVKHAEGAGID